MLAPRVEFAFCREGFFADDVLKGMSYFLSDLPILQHV